VGESGGGKGKKKERGEGRRVLRRENCTRRQNRPERGQRGQRAFHLGEMPETPGNAVGIYGRKERVTGGQQQFFCGKIKENEIKKADRVGHKGNSKNTQTRKPVLWGG